MELVRPLPRAQYEQHLIDLGEECSFCKEQGKLLIRTYTHWYFAYAAFPYRKYHTLIISKRHVLLFSQLTGTELEELTRITEDVSRAYSATGIVSQSSEQGDQLFFCWRARNPEEKRKKAVAHLHLHCFPERSKDPTNLMSADAWDIDLGLLSASIVDSETT